MNNSPCPRDPPESEESLIEEAVAEQQRVASRVLLGPARALPSTACGVDVSYHKRSDRAVAVAVVLDTASFEVLDSASSIGRSVFPYRPGLLSFRETPLVLDALGRLASPPELIVVDGHGYAHPARCGLASHLGVAADIPTIGCAKTMFVGTHGPLGDRRGRWADIVDDGERVGCALRTRTGVKPVYVSPGHMVDFRSARDIVLALSPRYRLPETTRQADQRSRALLKETHLTN